MQKKVLILVLLLVIGFASVSTSLMLNGNVDIAVKYDDFDVIFVDALLNEESNVIISENKKKITFISDKLTSLGDTAKLDYKVKNNSTQYGAKVTINCNTLGNEYVSITSEFGGQNASIENPVEMDAQEVKSGYLNAELVKMYTGEDDSVAITCEIIANPTSKDNVVDYIPYKYKDEILNGADPVLKDELIPVTIADNGTVTVASLDEKWYDYENKKWANAVILEDSYDMLDRQGKVHGATKKDGYVSFDGVDDYIDLGHENFDFSNGFTASVKFSLNSSPAAWENLGFILTNIEGNGMQIYFSRSNNLKFGITTPDEAKRVTSNKEFEVGVIYTVTCVYDGNNITMYIDGEKDVSTSVTGATSSSVPFYLGANPGKVIQQFSDSNIYESVIYERALTEDEIKNNFSSDIKITNTEDLLDYQDFTSQKSSGELLLEDSIESYFVWIPRYRYKIFDEGKYTSVINSKPSTSNAKEIQIEFESKDTTPSNGSTKDSWLTHPAFTNFDVNGLWIGKFETGYKGATSKESAQVNVNDSSKVIVRPNVYSWRDSTVANIFKTAYGYNRNLDSHMMKNTEWGAVAYLSHSKYGINSEVRINNNSEHKTGYASVDGIDQSNYPGTYGTESSITLPYNTSTGYKASTTGNITGVYDMNGGTHEYMAAYMDGYGVQNSATTKISSGFTLQELKLYNVYLDKYSSISTSISYNNRILGDATGEMGPFYNYSDKDGTERYHNNWYGDISYFVDSSQPWFYRDGNYDYGFLSGQFYFFRISGQNHTELTSRLVLSPK